MARSERCLAGVGVRGGRHMWLQAWLGWTLYGAVGLGLAFVLVVLLLVLLPRASLRRARTSVLLLLLHLAFLSLWAPFPADSPLHGWLGGTALFLLLACIGRSGVVLLTETRLSPIRT